MKYTLLEMVQIVASALDSDEVNSISDTVEADQIAKIVKTTYYDLATDLGLEEHETLFELTASGDSAKPTLMTVPSGILKINWIKYNNKEDAETTPNYKEVEYVPFEDFLREQQGLRELTTGVGTMTVVQNTESFELMYRSDRHPTKYTTLDDEQLYFNSFQTDVDTTLQKSKTMCHGLKYPTFTMSNSFTPDLNPQHFSLLLNTVKERAFNELKQIDNRNATKEARRQKIIGQKRRRIIPDISELNKVNRYGRSR